MDLDLTFVVQLGLVLTTLLFVGNVLLKPMLQVIELREKSIGGAKHESEALIKTAESKEIELREAMDGTRRAAMDERARLIAAARTAERQLLDSARANAQAKVDQARGKLQSQRAEVEVKLKAMSQDLAKVVASKMLAREV